jgi:hypothetical protein
MVNSLRNHVEYQSMLYVVGCLSIGNGRVLVDVAP